MIEMVTMVCMDEEDLWWRIDVCAICVLRVCVCGMRLIDKVDKFFLQLSAARESG